MYRLKINLQSMKRFYAAVMCKGKEDPCRSRQLKGLVVGIYTDLEDKTNLGKLTPTAEKYNKLTSCRLLELLRRAGGPPRIGEVKIFYGLEDEFDAVALVGLGKESQGYDVFEQMDESKENIRIAAAVGSRALQSLNIRKVSVESFGHAESSAEGAALGVWLYQEKKDPASQLPIPMLELHDDPDWIGWQIGLQKAAAQNLARQLMDTPANFMTPTSFAQNAVEVLCKSGVNVEVKVRAWAESQKMCAFLAATAGSCEPPIFLELSYYGTGTDERPVILIGKGITYNTGGLCVKSCEDQRKMRGDMAGAACVVAACRAVASLQLPLNVRGLIPLCENMPGCAAMRPGDIVRAMNGKSIQIDDTDCAGRLSLADALVYAQNFLPRLIVDIGSMSYDMQEALGSGSSAVFSNSEALWQYMLTASVHTGDRVWRFPLWNHFGSLIRDFSNVDVRTVGKGGKNNGCKIAAFLNEFVPCEHWMHIDCLGVLWSDGQDLPYLREGMSGRPTRTLVEFLSQLVSNAK